MPRLTYDDWPAARRPRRSDRPETAGRARRGRPGLAAVGLALLFAFVFDGPSWSSCCVWSSRSAWAILVWAQRATRAAGPGMRLDSLQVVGLSDGRPIGWGRVLLRWLVFAGLTVTVVGLIAMLS